MTPHTFILTSWGRFALTQKIYVFSNSFVGIKPVFRYSATPHGAIQWALMLDKHMFFKFPFVWIHTVFRASPYTHRVPGWLVCTYMGLTITRTMNEQCYNKQPIWDSKTRAWHCKAPVSHCKAWVWRCKAPADAECLKTHTALSPEARYAYENRRPGTGQYVQRPMYRA